MAERRTYRGKVIDVDSIQKQHEKTVAIGNMRVNAKGDTIGTGGTIVETAEKRARKHYDTTVSTTQKVGLKPDLPPSDELTEPNPTKKAKPKATIEVQQDNGDIKIQPKE